MKRKQKGFTNSRIMVMVFILSLMPVLLCACGYSTEEKKHVKEIARLGEENAVSYIKEKYGFTPEVIDVEICREREEGSSFPPATGYVSVAMSYQDEKFNVYITGEEQTLKGADDFEYGVITQDAKEYFEALLGYKIYDIYLQYRENELSGIPYLEEQEDNLLNERYEAHSFEDFLQQHPMNIRIDDTLNQDLTSLENMNPEAAGLLEKYARDCGLKAVLISYRSSEDYRNGYTHTYGKNGLLDFEIWKDGLYIQSYAAFDEEGADAGRFELQEYDSMIFCCKDMADGNDLMLSENQHEWQETDEDRGNLLSKVYSVDADDSGEITVYIPADKFLQYGANAAVIIQHYDDSQWRQYEGNACFTKDKKYVFITNYAGSFDFAVIDKK